MPGHVASVSKIWVMLSLLTKNLYFHTPWTSQTTPPKPFTVHSVCFSSWIQLVVSVLSSQLYSPETQEASPTPDSLTHPFQDSPPGHLVNLLRVSSTTEPLFRLPRTATAVSAFSSSPAFLPLISLKCILCTDSILNKLVKRHLWSYYSTLYLSSGNLQTLKWAYWPGSCLSLFLVWLPPRGGSKKQT